jgi:ABC-2 type transport system permease protein
MSGSESLIALYTLVRKQLLRFLRSWRQTLLPAAVTMVLFLLIFGELVGRHVGSLNGVAYIQYITPGLILMSVITNAYSNVALAFFGAKLQRNIEELLVSPMPNALIAAGFIAGGVLRGLLVGILVTAIAAVFAGFRVHDPWVMLAVLTLTATLFSCAGLINGIFAKSFDDTSVISTFVLTPLVYLGGVFYSVQLLPELWQRLSLANPVLYMVGGFRYGLIGVREVDLTAVFALLLGLIAATLAIALYLLDRGTGLKN